MFSIILQEEINAPADLLWQVITDTTQYPKWNPFVTACESSFDVGSPIIMHVQLTPRFNLKQKETIQANINGEHLAYGVNIPGLLNSSRRHIIRPIDSQRCHYESYFRLQGILAPVVRFFMAKHLQKGFSAMTSSLVAQTEMLAGKT